MAQLDKKVNEITVDSQDLKEKGTYSFTMTFSPVLPSFGAILEEPFKINLIDLCEQGVFEE